MDAADLYATVEAAAKARGIKIATIHTVLARWSISCPQCKVALPVGSEIAQPDTRNSEGGRVYLTGWYCPACAIRFAAQGPRVGVPWLSRADRDAHQEWMAEVRDLINEITDAGSRAGAQ